MIEYFKNVKANFKLKHYTNYICVGFVLVLFTVLYVFLYRGRVFFPVISGENQQIADVVHKLVADCTQMLQILLIKNFISH